jgi:hypothetical protein
MGLANEDDLVEKPFQQAKVFKFKNTGIHACGDLLPQANTQILFLWLRPKIQFVCDSI